MADIHNLQRFVDAQGPVYETARRELAGGRKRSHWMWFIFPQIHGLGFSPMAVRYAISGIDEAKAYLAHPVLGARLRECTGLVNAVAGRDLEAVLGYPDDLKFHSSVTLFAKAAKEIGGSENEVFGEALRVWFNGVEDAGTLGRLRV